MQNHSLLYGIISKIYPTYDLFFNFYICCWLDDFHKISPYIFCSERRHCGGPAIKTYKTNHLEQEIASVSYDPTDQTIHFQQEIASVSCNPRD